MIIVSVVILSLNRGKVSVITTSYNFHRDVISGSRTDELVTRINCDRQAAIASVTIRKEVVVPSLHISPMKPGFGLHIRR